MRKSEYVLFEEREAANFYEMYPIGNGSLGGSVYGTLPKMRLGINHDTLWTGDASSPFDGWGTEDFLAARGAALRGEYRKATEEISNRFGKYDAACFQAPGNLYFDFGEAEYTAYRRSLNLRDAIAEVAFSQNGTPIRVSYIASNPDSAIFAHITAEKAVNFAVIPDFSLATEQKMASGTLIINGECPIASERHRERGSFPPDLVGKRGVRFSCAVCVTGDGDIACTEKGIFVKNATAITVAVCIFTSYAEGRAHGRKGYEEEAISSVLAASRYSFDEALARHIADVRTYFDRVSLSFDSRDRSNLPTSERIRSFEGEDGTLDGDLVTLSYNLSRYLLIASSREGGMPPNLQGIWNDSPYPPWCGNYTTNINLQMNYWGAFSSGLFELFEPLEHYTRILAKNGEACARTIYGARGFAAHHNSDIFGYSAPTYGKTRWFFFPFAGAWTVGELYRKYEYTQDAAYLARIYPLLEGCAQFALDTLVDDGEYFIFAPGASPENDYLADGEICEVARSSSMFGALIREALANFIGASDRLGIENSDVLRAREVFPRLLPIRTTDDGCIEEWYFGNRTPENFAEKDPGHRHTSHLYDLYPAHNITLADKALAKAAKKSLDVRDAGKAMGWSAVWRMCMRARLGDSEAVTELLRRYFTYVAADAYTAVTTEVTGVYCNLLSAHPFQIDANLGFAAAVAEMLVGEKDGELIPLPALPKGLSSGSVRGLYVRGDRRVDMTFSDGRVTEFKVY